MWKRERERMRWGKKSSASVLKTAPATVLISRWWEKMRLQQWHTDCDTTMIMLLFRWATAPTTDIRWNFRKTRVCVCVCGHFIYARLVVEKPSTTIINRTWGNKTLCERYFVWPRYLLKLSMLTNSPRPGPSCLLIPLWFSSPYS